MPKNIHFNEVAREQLKSGLDKLAKAVKITLGPMGRNVVIQQAWGAPHVTKDGVTVARDIELEDPVENMGAQMLKQAALKTSDTAGDGTTTATVLAEKIVSEGMQSIAKGSNPIDIKAGIDMAVELAIKYLNETAIEVKGDMNKIKQIGTISANNDQEVGELLSGAMEKVGPDGIITVEEGNGTETTIEIVNGMQIERGYISPYFVTDPNRMVCEYEKPLILISDKKVESPIEIINILETAAGAKRPILLIVDGLDTQSMSMLVTNRVKHGLQVVAIRPPGFANLKKEILEDIISITGGEFLSDQAGDQFENYTNDMFGTCEKIIIDKDKTIFVGGPKTNSEKRIKSLKSLIAGSKNDYEKEGLEKRLAALSGGIAVINVGAHTELEMKEKKDRIDDALHATKAATMEGIVPGGGLAYYNASEFVLNEIAAGKGVEHDIICGVDCVISALREPMRVIAQNAGRDPEIVRSYIERETLNNDEKAKNFGFNAKSSKYGNLLEEGIIDPKKVARCAIQNAASVASMILLTECAISDTKPQLPDPTN